MTYYAYSVPRSFLKKMGIDKAITTRRKLGSAEDPDFDLDQELQELRQDVLGYASRGQSLIFLVVLEERDDLGQFPTEDECSEIAERFSDDDLIVID